MGLVYLFSRPICNYSDCTAPNGVVGMNYAMEGHCTMLSLSILHIYLITCMQGFRTISCRIYSRIRKFRDTVTQLVYERRHEHRKISNCKARPDVLSLVGL
jgi:hypothetical protein